MIRILLACGIGPSTGFMAANMRKAAKAKGLDVTIHAVSKSQVPEYADKIDVLLLGPQIRFQLKKFREELAPMGIPVDVIEMADYGRMNGAAVLKKAMDLVQPK